MVSQAFLKFLNIGSFQRFLPLKKNPMGKRVINFHESEYGVICDSKYWELPKAFCDYSELLEFAKETYGDEFKLQGFKRLTEFCEAK